MRVPCSGTSLRILFVNSGLGYGGAETQLIAILRELQRRGHQPSLYLLTRHAPRLEEVTGQGIPVTVDHKSSRLDFAVLRRLRMHIKNDRPQLVHGFLFDGNVYARLAGFGLGIPILNSERSHGYELRPMQRLIHYPTRFMADGMVANTHAGCDFARRLFGLDAAHSHTAWNGIDLEAVDARIAVSPAGYRREFFDDAKVRLAVMVGTIKYQKDHLLAIEVAERLCDEDPNWRVVFVGTSFGSRLAYMTQTDSQSNALSERVAARAQSSRHTERMRFVGQRQDVLEIIADADVLFSTSLEEGFPNVILEAMSVGTLAVSTNYSDIALILPKPLVVKTRDPLAIATAIQRAAEPDSPTTAASLRSWVEANATIGRSVDALLGVYGNYLFDGASK